jgi:hypothetical protein
MHRILSVTPKENFHLQLRFEDGKIKMVDCTSFIGQGMGAPLLDANYFNQVSLEPGGGITWPNGFDCCPNFLYDFNTME